MNIKKIGLTALAGALVSVSANAADLSVTGSASLNFAGEEKQSTGNGWTMGTGVTFAASAEMDNGWVVSTSQTLNNDRAAEAIDNSSMTIDMGDAGSLTFYGDGGSGAVSKMDDTTPTAGEESWDDVTGGTDHVSGATGDDTFLYTNSSLMDDLSISVAYIPSDAGSATAVSASVGSSVDYTVTYTGIENLTISAGAGENNNAGPTNSYDMTVLNATYTYDAISVGWSTNEADSNKANEDRTLTAFGVSYAVNDDISVSLNSSETEVEGGTDQEAFGISASMVVGSMTISANHNSIENTGGTAGSNLSGYNLNLAFAF
jgi:outer membrane protein OmpU